MTCSTVQKLPMERKDWGSKFWHISHIAEGARRKRSHRLAQLRSHVGRLQSHAAFVFLYVIQELTHLPRIELLDWLRCHERVSSHHALFEQSGQCLCESHKCVNTHSIYKLQAHQQSCHCLRESKKCVYKHLTYTLKAHQQPCLCICESHKCVNMHPIHTLRAHQRSDQYRQDPRSWLQVLDWQT